MDFDALRSAVKQKRYLMKQHAVVRCQQRGYTTSDVEKIIVEGEVLERSPLAEPHPKCLVMKIIDGEPTYVAVAYDPIINYAYIITVHGFDPDKWEDPYTRKRR